MILLDAGISNINKSFVNIDFFSYASFRKRFMKLLLDMIENDIGKNKFRKIKNSMYFEHQEGFYVCAPPKKFKSLTELIKYVCRYVARPVMAESGIIYFDGDDKIYIFKCTKCKFEDPIPDWLLDEFGGFSLLNKKVPKKNFKNMS